MVLYYKNLLSANPFKQVMDCTIFKYCRMANFPVSFTFLLFPECFQRGINKKKRYNTCLNLTNTEKSLSLPINIYSLVY